MTYSIETTVVTPEMARLWLETKPEHQRRVNATYVQRLAETLAAGTFTNSPQPFIIDTNGDLMDGQHRAAAVALSGVPLEAVVVRGVAPDMFGKLDIGQRRTPAQFIQSSHSSLVASAARWTLHYGIDQQVMDGNHIQRNFSIAQIVAEVEQRPMLEALAGPVSLVSKATHINGPILLAITTLGAAAASDQVEDWLDGLNTGANLEVGDPRLTLRNVFISNYRMLNGASGVKRRAYVYILKSWNAFVMDENLRMLRFRPNRAGSMSGEALSPIVGAP